MPKVKLKTAPTAHNATAFLKSIEDPDQRADCRILAKIFREATRKRPEIWGTSIVGYGRYEYKYASGREGEYFRTGFSPRKGTLVVYIMPGYTDHGALLNKLGRHRVGKSCLYIKRLEDIDLAILERLIKAGWADMEQRYGTA